MSDFPQGPDWWQASDYKWYPPQPPQQQWGYQQYTPYGYTGGPNPFESRGTTVLVLGIVSLIICPIVLGPVALIMGNGVRRDARAAGYDEPGTSKAGRICGIISCCLVALIVVLFAAGVIGGSASTP